MPILRYFSLCLRLSKSNINSSNTKQFNGNDNLEVFYTNDIPDSIKELLVYIAREGVAVVDLFRRPGNSPQINKVIRQLKLGESIDWTKYNFYTLANIAKRYLIQIDKGILGEEVESHLLATLDLPDDESRLEAMSGTLQSLSPEVLQLLALLFGTWFRMIYHTEVNAMSVEAVAKSVAGSIFRSCSTNPSQVIKASKVMEYLITGFASSELFGGHLIEYFANETQTSISRTEKFKYEFIYPKDISRKKSTRLFVRMLLEESSKHGFDLLKDEVTEEVFNTMDNNVRTKDPIVEDIHIPATNSDLKSRRRHLNKTMTYPYERSSRAYTDQVQQISEKRTCVTASSTYIGRTTMKRSVSQESIHSGVGGAEDRNIDILSPLPTTNINDGIISEFSDKEKSEEVKIRSQSLQQNEDGFNLVKSHQMERLQKRSLWFLSAPTGCKSETLIQLSSSPESQPNIDEMSSESTKNGRISDPSISKEADVVRNLSSPIPFSDAQFFQSNNDNDLRDLPTSFHHYEPSLSDEEVEVRYFVVHKCYGQNNS